MWMERHINHSKLCKLVTARFAGGSYLNKVELQNGCLALGHSNLFIPSTINGSNFDSNRKLDKTKLKQNLEAAIDVYISAVNGSPCGGKPIHLVKGAQDELSKTYQERRQRLITFLRGTKKKKDGAKGWLSRGIQVFFKGFRRAGTTYGSKSAF